MKLDQLRAAPLLAGFADAELHELAQAFQTRSFPAGALLFREGEPGDRFAIVLRGEVEIIKALGTAEERLLAVVAQGDFLGEMSLLDPSGLRSAGARARTATEWAEITAEAFEALLHQRPALSLQLMRAMNSRLRRSEAETIRDLQAKNQALQQAYLQLQRAQAALVEKEKLEHELEIARAIQQSMLPKALPQLPGWQLAAHWRPARAVSGDFYDFLPYADGRLGLLIADVTGKGVPAALVMATTTTLLRTVVAAESEPAAILARANELLLPLLPESIFVTCLYMLLEPATGRICFANAGHSLPMTVVQGVVQEPRATGMPLGLLPGRSYSECTIELPPGGGLLLHTDGIAEAHNAAGEMFGLARLRACLAAAPFGPALEAALDAQLAAFVGPHWEPEDDITWVTLARE